ncbi:MAG: DUF3991 and toprim domain-containing protein [Verrucomicrobiales bacterium]|nr:DUF3991 and toprim domain-containing protein [Verrucomicrobiales bacterium]
MIDRAEELEAFKRRINLSEYAASCGYVLDRKASSRNSAVMRHANGDKVIVACAHDGHWIYFSVRDDNDHGSIIDFVQRRQGGSLGDVRRTLRPFLDGFPSPALDRSTFAATLEPASKDLIRVRARLEAMEVTRGHHPYLERERRIPVEILAHPRFADRIHIDGHGNVIFPHWNLSGVCGYEIKNHNFTGFALGGEKGLWESNRDASDTAVVIAETAIDALSHFALKRPIATCYVSTAGTLNPSQPELIRLAADRLRDGGRVILATDNDAGGDALTARIREFLALEGRLEILEDRPAERGADWNDVLRNPSL